MLKERSKTTVGQVSSVTEATSSNSRGNRPTSLSKSCRPRSTISS
jgi:hypothetical protein